MNAGRRREDDDRAQVGVELLVVFIAAVVVAAIAASLLLNTALALQVQAEETGEESLDQLTDRVQVVSAIGEVGDDRVETVRLRVRTAPGTDSVDLEAASVQTVGDGVDPSPSVEVVGGDDAVLTEGSDIGYVRIYGESGLDEGAGLSPGDEVTVRITTAAGATTTHVLRVPSTLAGKSVVEL